MRLYRSVIALAACLALFSCAKEKSEPPRDQAPGEESFQPRGEGAVWHYRDSLQGSFTLTSTGEDTVMGDVTYTRFTNVLDSTGLVTDTYFGQQGEDYYTAGFIPSVGETPLLYLKAGAAVGGTWTQDFSYAGQDATLHFTIKEKNISKTVQGHAYTGVTHVGLDIKVMVPGLGEVSAAQGELYFARGVGVIFESLTTLQGSASQVSLLSYTP